MTNSTFPDRRESTYRTRFAVQTNGASSLLVNGARSALQAALRAAPDKATRLQQWMVGLAGRCGYQKALVAIANQHARMIWAMLARDEAYDPQAW